MYMNEDFIYGAEGLTDLTEKRLIENGRLCQDCRMEIGDLARHRGRGSGTRNLKS